MSRKIKMVSYGLGRMGKVGVKYAIGRDMEIIGAYDMYSGIHGQDIGEFVGEEKIGVEIRDSALFAEEIKVLKPDICVIIGRSLLKDFEYPFTACAEAGVNAVTIAEEMLFPRASNPTLTEKLDKIAKKNGCTLTGTGGQEMCWGSLVSTVAASANTIKKITGITTNNLDDYGIAFAETFGIGLTKEEFEEQIAKTKNVSDKDVANEIIAGTFEAAFMWNSSAWLCDRLGYRIKSIAQKIVPVYAEKAVYSNTLERDIEAGQVLEASQVVTLETMDGMVIESELYCTVYKDGQTDINNWRIISDENVYAVDMPSMPSVEITLGSVMNRIPDIIAAEPGVVSTGRMPAAKFRRSPMYLEED